MSNAASTDATADRYARGGMKKKFELSDASTAFYTVHDHADGERSDAGRGLLSRFAQTDETRTWSG